MTNGEKYRDDIFREYGSSSNFCKEFIQKRILGTDNCDGKTCTQCQLMQMVWLNEEYKDQKLTGQRLKLILLFLLVIITNIGLGDILQNTKTVKYLHLLLVRQSGVQN